MTDPESETHIIDLPSLFPTPGRSEPTTPYSILVLNQPVNEKAYDALSEHASYIICADAGADRLLHLTGPNIATTTSTTTTTTSNSRPHEQQQQQQPRRRLPDAIVGDLDSVLPSTLQHYRSQGVTIAHDPDQYSTDFTKGLKFIRELVSRRHSPTTTAAAADADAEMDIIAFGGLGGRVDQAFSIIHHLFAASARADWLRGDVYLIGSESLSMILRAGRNVVRVGAGAWSGRSSDPDNNNNDGGGGGGEEEEEEEEDESQRRREGGGPGGGKEKPTAGFFDANVGIIPVTGKAVISTEGLEWDVREWATEFGGQISTSNHLCRDEVVVETDRQVLFTLEFAERFSAAGS